MRRRTFVGVLSGVMAAPRLALAQAAPIPVVGFLHSASVATNQTRVAGFLAGLKATGRVVGQNIAVEYRWAEGDFNRLPSLVEELLRHPVAVLVTGAPPAALAARSAATTTPIVFVMGADPVRLGLVQSFSRPGGNITGAAVLTISLVTKRLEMILRLVPTADSIGFIVNPANPTTEDQIVAIRSATQALGQRLEVMRVSHQADIESLSDKISAARPKALVVGADSFLQSQRKGLVALAARHAIPAIYETRESVVVGGLASYAGDFVEGFRQAGIYAGRILNGERPAELPVVQPTKFELALNLRTARALGLVIPPTVLALADEVIE